MDDATDHRDDPDGESADIRMGRHAIGLLDAARKSGDPVLIAHAQALALAAGYALAEHIRDAPDRD